MPLAEVTMFPDASTTNTTNDTTRPFHTVGAGRVERTLRRRRGGRGTGVRVSAVIGDQNWK